MLDKQVQKQEVCFILFIFILGSLLHFWCTDFSRAIQVLPDEVRYYGIARSLFDGNGLMVRSFSTDFQKIAYALFLAPCFQITDGMVRMRVIGLMNSVLMMSSVFPAWLITRQLKLDREQRYVVLILLTVWPDLMYSSTVMAEVLYWPILLLFVYLWLLNLEKKSVGIAVAEGLLCYLGYLTKEIFLAGLLTLIFFEGVYPLVEYMTQKEEADKTEKFHLRDGMRCSVITAAVFLLAYVLMKLLVFRHMGNSYDQMSLDAIADPYHFSYMIYAFLYYLAAAIVAVLIFPVVYPLWYYKRMTPKQKDLFLFLTLYLLTAAATVAYTISVREDFGELIPRVHLRYIGPILFLYVLLFLSCVIKEGRDAHGKGDFSRPFRVTSAVLFTGLLLLIYKGIDPEIPIDGQTLNWNHMIMGWITRGNWQHKKIVALGVLFLILLLFSCFMVILLKCGKGKVIARTFAIVVGFICLLNSCYAQRSFYQYFHEEEHLIREVMAINDYLREQGAEDVLFVSAGYTGVENCIDTYLDMSAGLYFVGDSYIKEHWWGDISLKDEVIPAEYNLWEMTYQPKEIEYIILDKQADLGDKGFSRVEEIDVLSQGAYIVYRNQEPDQLCFESR